MTNASNKLKLAHITCAILCLLFSMKAFSACNAIRCTGGIEKIYVTGNSGGIVLVEPADAIRPLNCRAKKNTYLSLKKSHPMFNEIYSLLLTAKITDTAVTLRIRENTNGCDIIYVTM